TALIVATNVYGGTSTSSPGPMSRAAREATRAVVPHDVARQCLEPSLRAQASSNWAAHLPPVRFQRPPRRTSIQAFSSFSRSCGQEGKRRARTGAPPSSAGLSMGFDAAPARAVTEAAPRKVLRELDITPRALSLESGQLESILFRNNRWGP